MAPNAEVIYVTFFNNFEGVNDTKRGVLGEKLLYHVKEKGALEEEPG